MAVPVLLLLLDDDDDEGVLLLVVIAGMLSNHLTGFFLYKAGQPGTVNRNANTEPTSQYWNVILKDCSIYPCTNPAICEGGRGGERRRVLCVVNTKKKKNYFEQHKLTENLKKGFTFYSRMRPK